VDLFFGRLHTATPLRAVCGVISGARFVKSLAPNWCDGNPTQVSLLQRVAPVLGKSKGKRGDAEYAEKDKYGDDGGGGAGDVRTHPLR